MRSLINFIKYNNGFPVILVVIFLGAGGAFAASQGAKQMLQSTGTTISTTVPTLIDTSKLLSTNLDRFDSRLKIIAVTQDGENYFVKYVFQTLSIVDTSWAVTPKTATMTVAKKLLGSRDLGLYVAGQLGQVVDQELAYLRGVQGAEKAKSGLIAQGGGGKYASLDGRTLDTKEKTLDGYKPVVKPTVDGTKKMETNVQPAPAADVTTVETVTETAQTLLSKKEIEDMIVAAVAQFLAVDTSMPNPTIPVPTVPAPPDPAAADGDLDTPVLDTGVVKVAPETLTP